MPLQAVNRSLVALRFRATRTPNAERTRGDQPMLLRTTRRVIPSEFFKRVHAAYWREHKRRYVEKCKDKALNLNIPTREAYGRRFEFYRTVNDAYVGIEPINYLEFGTFKGASINAWRKLHQHAESRFFGFDTFEGLPEKWKEGFDAGHFSTGGRPPEIDDDRVSFVQGLFQDTLDGVLATLDLSKKLVIHVDSDLYSSALYVLTRLDSVLARNSVIIFDQWTADDEYRAFVDYVNAYRRNLSLRATMNDDYVKVMFLVE